MAFVTGTKRNKPQELDAKYPQSEDRHTEGKNPRIETNYKPVSNEINTKKGYPINLKLNDISSRIKPVPISDPNQLSNGRRILNNDYLEKPMTEFRKLYTDLRSSLVDGSRSTVGNRTIKGVNSPKSSRSPLRKPCYETNEQIETPLPLEVLELQVKKEALMKEKEEKIVELEILKDNINKIYHLETRKSPTGQLMSVTSDAEDRDNYRTNKDKPEHTAKGEYEVNKVMESSPLSVDGRDSGNTSDVPPDAEGEGKQLSPKMTIMISPKRSPVNLNPTEERKSVSPEQAARLTRNDVLDAIFHRDGLKETSSCDLEMESKDEQETVTDEEQGAPEDYPDDFSGDVDFNGVSDYGNSPISLSKPIDDEIFWDS